jgi:uncharacterized protein YheU (UPF0270 family)
VNAPDVLLGILDSTTMNHYLRRERTIFMSEEVRPPLVIPHTELSADALQGVIESFVLREGTEYGATDFSLQQKVAHVTRQLERGEAQIVFDPNSESIDIVVTPAGAGRL